MIVTASPQKVYHCMSLNKSSCCIGRTAYNDHPDTYQKRDFFVTESNQDMTFISSQVGKLEEDLEVEDVSDKIRLV